MFNQNSVLGWAVAVILIAYTAYSCYKGIKLYKEHSTALKNFKLKHKDARLFDCSRGWVISSVVMIFVCIVIALNIDKMDVDPSSYFLYRLAYACIAIIFVSIVLSSLSGKRIWFIDDGFFFNDRYFKFRDISKRAPIGGVGSRNLYLVMKDNYEITINKKMDEKIDTEVKLWKQKKKNKQK